MTGGAQPVRRGFGVDNSRRKASMVTEDVSLPHITETRGRRHWPPNSEEFSGNQSIATVPGVIENPERIRP
jgi:hypothetical protein